MLCNFPIWFFFFSVLCFPRAGWKVWVGLSALRNICACDIHCSLQTLTVFSAATWKKLLKTGVFRRSKLLHQSEMIPLLRLKVWSKLKRRCLFWRQNWYLKRERGLPWPSDTLSWKLLRLLTNANSLRSEISVVASLPRWMCSASISMAAVVILMWMSSKLIFLTPVLIQSFFTLLQYCLLWFHFSVEWFCSSLGKRQNYTGRLSLIKKSTFWGVDGWVFLSVFWILMTEYRFALSLYDYIVNTLPFLF